ncbi:MAG: PilZ domain-containing protein [Bacteroidota bacterium]
METNSGKEHRRHLRIIAKSIIVSLTDKHADQQITGFLKDISEGGMKIQKISAKRQVEKGEYHCEFVLPDSGKIDVLVEVLGFGYEDEKFSEHLIRMRFLDLDPATKDKIEKYIANNRTETETTD